MVRRTDGPDGVVAENFGGGPGFFGPVEFDVSLRAKTTGGEITKFLFEKKKTREEKTHVE